MIDNDNHLDGAANGEVRRPRCAPARRLVCDDRRQRAFLVLAHDRASGDSVVVLSVCWTGDSEDARGRLDSLRSTTGLLLDAVRPTSYLQLQAVFGEIPFGTRARGRR
ncbi:MAG: hypothetical protein AABM30_04225 [Actinomycetota bacterium]